MTDSDLLWIVGFFEGEGSCGCYTRKEVAKSGKLYIYKNGTLIVSICQKRKDILKWILKEVGYGSLFYSANPDSFGHSVWTWRAASLQAEKFLLMIQPYLKSKYRIKQVNKSIRLWQEAKKH